MMILPNPKYLITQLNIYYKEHIRITSWIQNIPACPYIHTHKRCLWQMHTFTCHQIQSRKELIMRAGWLWWWCIFQCSAITTGMLPPAELVLSETSTQNPY